MGYKDISAELGIESISRRGVRRRTLSTWLQPKLPREFEEASWLIQESRRLRNWEFSKDTVYQIDENYLIYLRDEGKHHIFRSYFAKWLTTYTDMQLVGTEVICMDREVKKCPHCGGNLLKMEATPSMVGGTYVCMVTCQKCKAVTSWRINPGLNRQKDPAEANLQPQDLAMYRLRKAWNRRDGDAGQAQG